jgi:hypothetical protein
LNPPETTLVPFTQKMFRNQAPRVGTKVQAGGPSLGGHGNTFEGAMNQLV